MNEQTLKLLEDPEGFIRDVLARELEPLRALLVKPAGEAPPELSELVDAAEVARLMGEDLSTEQRKRAALQKVYDLARRGLIPSVRVSPRRIKFDPAAVKRAFAEGSQAQPYTLKPAAQAATNSLRP